MSILLIIKCMPKEGEDESWQKSVADLAKPPEIHEDGGPNKFALLAFRRLEDAFKEIEDYFDKFPQHAVMHEGKPASWQVKQWAFDELYKNEKLFGYSRGSDIATLFAGDKSARTEKFRDALLAELGHDISKARFLASSIEGMDDEESWKIRDSLANKKPFKASDGSSSRSYTLSTDAARSTTGLSGHRAMDLRRKALNDMEAERKKIAKFAKEYFKDRPFDSGQCRDDIEELADRAIDSVLVSLEGQDSEEAWKIRDEALRLRGFPVLNAYERPAGSSVHIEDYLIGLDSERAWKERDQAVKYPLYGSLYFNLARSIQGVDSDRAWELRGKMFELAQTKKDKMGYRVPREENLILTSLAGCNSERAWEYRKSILERVRSGEIGNTIFNSFSESLVGLSDTRQVATMIEVFEASCTDEKLKSRMRLRKEIVIEHGGHLLLVLNATHLQQ